MNVYVGKTNLEVLNFYKYREVPLSCTRIFNHVKNVFSSENMVFILVYL
jgi:hypothetical protein